MALPFLIFKGILKERLILYNEYMNNNYYIFTIGCQMNVSDSERIASVLEDLGYKKTEKESEADLIMTVACSVRQSAIDRIYGQAKKWTELKKKNPQLLIALTGCLLLADKEKFRYFGICKIPKSRRSANRGCANLLLPDVTQKLGQAEKPLIDFIFDIKDLPKLPKLLAQSPELRAQSLNYLEIKPSYNSSISAYLPISTGCDNFCSYCVVPYTRGREVSKSSEEIISEVKELVEKGYKEITLLGQNVNSYNTKLKMKNVKCKMTQPPKVLYGGQANQNSKSIKFTDLLKKINEIPGKFWIRFLTSHPKDMSDELIKAISECEKVTEYIHLPVQAGDNEILRQMNRGYAVEDYLNLCSELRAQCPGLSLSTDIIVGFPGESKKQFEKTKKLMEKVKFDMAYIVRYSPRLGTTAYKLKDDVPKEEKKRRERILNEILKKTALENNKRYLGKTVEVLVSNAQSSELRAQSRLSGRTRTFKPVQFIGPKSLVGQFRKVKITACNPWGLKGKLLKNKT